jgi:hypothetical protein
MAARKAPMYCKGGAFELSHAKRAARASTGRSESMEVKGFRSTPILIVACRRQQLDEGCLLLLCLLRTGSMA